MKEELILKSRRNLERECSEIDFLKKSIITNEAAGRSVVVRELQAKLRWRLRLKEVYSEFINDLKKLKDEN